MNRLILIIFCMLTAITFCTAQEKTAEQLSPTNKSRNAIISLAADRNDNSAKLPFSAIEIRDVRPDTTKLGFYRSTKDGRHYKYCFANSSNQHIEAFLNDQFRNNFDASASAHLVIYIKKLWLSEFDSSELNTHNTHVKNAWLYLTSEIYLQTHNTYLPVYRYDSVVYARKKNNYTSGGFIASTLLESLDRLNNVDFAQLHHRRKITQSQVDSFYQQYANRTTVKPVKGVYLSFSDFKNNRPAYTDFEVRFESLADIVYVREADGQLYPKKNIWGISNGEKVFIRMAANYFPLYNQNKTWEFYGSAATDTRGFRMPVILGAGLPLAIASAGAAQFSSYDEKQLVNMRAFQVDIENGKFY
jgi:hypothetical protein